jgi:hypothetical protein
VNFQLRLDLPPQNLQFTGRTKELQQLSDIIKGGGKGQRKVAVLHGLGGIGKTNIVCEYAWRNRTAYSCVIWIHAGTAEVLENSFISVVKVLVRHLAANSSCAGPNYAEIACGLGIPGLISTSGQLVYNTESDDQDRIVEAVLKWLSLDGNDNWLLVFDNVDDLKVIDKAKHFPQSSSGTIIITSRRRGSAQWGTKSFQVDEMDKEDALDLLMSRANLEWNQLSEEGEYHTVIYSNLATY